MRQMSIAIPTSVARSPAILRTQRAMLDRPVQERSLEETVRTVIRCIEEVGVDWCLVGAHALGIYVEPRATSDFDFVVDDRRMKALLATLERELGDLGMVDIDAAVRLMKVDVNLIRARSNALFRAALNLAESVGEWRLPPSRFSSS